MAVLHGAIAFLRHNNNRVAKVTNIEIDPEMPTVRSDPVGQYHADEIIYTGSYVTVSFDIEREPGKSLTQQGIWPKQSSTSDILGHPEYDIEVISEETGDVIDRVKGFRPNRASRVYRKGEMTVFRVTGEGLKLTDEAEN